MIRNREELQALSAAWVNQAKNDVRNTMIHFMEESGLSEEEVSNILGVDEDVISDILSGRCELSLDTFAKLLIASGLILEIKPLNPRMQGYPQPFDQVPFDVEPQNINSMNRMPRMGGMPLPYVGAPHRTRRANRRVEGNQPMVENDNLTDMPSMEDMPHMDGMPSMEDMPQLDGMPMGRMPRMGGMPMGRMPRMGGMPMGRMPRMGGAPMGRMPRMGGMTMEEMPRINEREISQGVGNTIPNRRSLVEEIVNNHWENEIDLINTSETEMMEFLNHKKHGANVSQVRESRHNERQPQGRVMRNNHGMDRTQRLMDLIHEEAEKNPEFNRLVSKFLG